MNGRVVFWDWNGTLLNDAQYAMQVRNRVFPRFGLPQIANIEAYHEQFTFPVKLYYERAGVTEDMFSAVANAWMDEYMAGCGAVPLFADALDALDAFQAGGYKQVVLSASKREHLCAQLENAGILHRFDDVLGLSHIYATDKTEIARDWLSRNGCLPAHCLLLGDTVHDALVAQALQMDCALIARGHMSRQTLQKTGCPVFDTLADAVQAVIGRNAEGR